MQVPILLIVYIDYGHCRYYSHTKTIYIQEIFTMEE